jgi:hypothetical protein
LSQTSRATQKSSGFQNFEGRLKVTAATASGVIPHSGVVHAPRMHIRPWNDRARVLGVRIIYRKPGGAASRIGLEGTGIQEPRSRLGPMRNSRAGDPIRRPRIGFKRPFAGTSVA